MLWFSSGETCDFSCDRSHVGWQTSGIIVVCIKVDVGLVEWLPIRLGLNNGLYLDGMCRRRAFYVMDGRS